jgi:cytochrome c-type biogenesis protein CcmH/NrfG
MVANCYIKLGEWENAQLILEKLVQDKPENPRYWMSLAEVYYNNKEVDKTIECVKHMVKLRPTNADYLSTLAQLYHESAYYDLYVQILYRMLELDPLNHEIKAEIEKYS